MSVGGDGKHQGGGMKKKERHEMDRVSILYRTLLNLF